jgi:hypothetical protein
MWILPVQYLVGRLGLFAGQVDIGTGFRHACCFAASRTFD